MERYLRNTEDEYLKSRGWTMTGFETTLRTPHTKNPNVQCILLQKLSIHQTPQCSNSILNSKLESKHVN